jgi:DNA-binding LacI/PurR family transcriptional regulator
MSQLTIEDIARLTGVSRSTVSRVLNGQPRVRTAVRDQVKKVISTYGYTPQVAARQLVTQKARTIGIVSPDNAYHLFSNPIFTLMGQGVGQACSQRGYHSLLFMGQHDMDEQALFSLLRGRQFDGVVLISGERNDSCPMFLQKIGMPYVRIGHDPERDDLKYIDIDNAEAARMAVNHLISLGHRRIALLRGLEKDICTSARYEGYKQALEEAGIPLDPELVGDGNCTVAGGYETTQRFLQLAEPPTALFSSNDMTVPGVIRATVERGLRVPNDLAIVGFDDLPQTTMIFPELTTVSQPYVEMGSRAAALLIDQLEKEKQEHAHIILPTKLVIRASCGAQPPCR